MAKDKIFILYHSQTMYTQFRSLQTHSQTMYTQFISLHTNNFLQKQIVV